VAQNQIKQKKNWRKENKGFQWQGLAWIGESGEEEEEEERGGERPLAHRAPASPPLPLCESSDELFVALEPGAGSAL